MNGQMIASLVRSILLITGVLLADKGHLDNAQVELISGAAVSMFSIIWGQLHHYNGANNGS